MGKQKGTYKRKEAREIWDETYRKIKMGGFLGVGGGVGGWFILTPMWTEEKRREGFGRIG